MAAAFPYPVLQASLPGDHDRAGRRRLRVALRLVIVQQAPRGNEWLAGMLSFVIREQHATMMTAPLAEREAITGRFMPSPPPCPETLPALS
jgi:hypothetical protein